MAKTPGELAFDELAGKARDFLRDNPALAVATAALATEVFSSLTSSPARRGSSRATIRDWLDSAYDTMPVYKQFKSAAESAGLPTTYGQAKGKVSGWVERLP
jgi:hypothetical protein